MRLLRIIFILIVAFTLNQSFAQESHDFEISKNLDIYTTVIQQLNAHYVDDIKPGELSKAAIDAMLKQLDPYTVYFTESQIEDVRFLQTGKYGGVGSRIYKVGDKVIVGMPYQGFPFHKVGIRAGDEIIAIDGENVTGKSLSDISDRLRGVAGTDLEVSYFSVKDKLQKNINIKREQIVVKDVPYYGLLEDGIAYVNLVGFKQNAAKEVKYALDSLSKEKKLNSLVLDLRNNGGGLLIQAVNILDLFVGSDQLIVSTKGKVKSENNSYKTRKPALYPDLKIVVLVNDRSASASEIVAGSIQDLDRGVIMGQKSYGKGLVQKVYPLSYRSQVKITVAKYYIPSGRCIQSLNYDKKDNNGSASKTPDSLMHSFKTKNGRLVKDAGGIIPDIITEKQEYSDLVLSLIQSYKIFDFATEYVYSNDSIESLNDFEISDKVYDSFIQKLEHDSFDFVSQVEKKLQSLIKQTELSNYALNEELKLLKTKIDSIKREELYTQKEIIKSLLRQEIISRYYYNAGRVESKLKDDSDIKEAISILKDNARYNSILKI